MALRKTYWITFGLSVIILLLNIGLGLFVFGIFILAVLIMHFQNGMKLKSSKGKNNLIMFSALNLLAFALVRPDGVHTTTGTGLSSLLRIFGFSSPHDSRFENYYYIIAITLLVLQFVLEIRLRRANKLSHN